MDPIRHQLRWLQARCTTYHLRTVALAFSRFAPQAVHRDQRVRCDTCIRICVDLAGVDRSLIDLTVEPRRLVIRGTRELPEPTGDEECAQQLLAMEIDYGRLNARSLSPLTWKSIRRAAGSVTDTLDFRCQ